jgi:demethylmenaquinone methyltransferase/2-methoxy-6-polyprenyl-1,4-benzoquinol methylase
MEAVPDTDPGRPLAPPERDVAELFDAIVPRYDALNRALSLGLDQRWRRAAVRAAGLRPGERALDLGCGTGDLAVLLSARADVVGLDLSRAMLRAARVKAGGAVRLVQGSAMHLPFGDASFDAVASAFVLRNLRDLNGALAEVVRVLRPGGRVALVDITGPRRGPARVAFDAWFRVAPPILGRLVGHADAYHYLPRSLAQLPSPAEVVDLLAAAGVTGCRATSLTLGAVTLFTGRTSVEGP